MSDAFFTSKKRPFSTRTKDASATSSSKPSRSGVSSRGASRGRGESRGRGRGAATSTRGGGRGSTFNKGKRRAEEEDEELDEGDSDGGSEKLEAPEEFSSEEEDDLETPAQKRLRLSQMYLKSLEKDKEGAFHLSLSLPAISTVLTYSPTYRGSGIRCGRS
jgi:ribosomal RNA-processing protein 9